MNNEKIAPPVAMVSVDTPAFRKMLPMFLPTSTEKWAALVVFLNAWGAQQREAGRRDAHETNMAVLNDSLKATERAEKAEEGLAQLQYERDNLQKLAISRREWAEKAEAELAQVNEWRAAALASNQQMQELMAAKLAAAESRAARLEHFFKHHSLLVPPQYAGASIVGDSIPGRQDQHPNAIDPSDTPC